MHFRTCIWLACSFPELQAISNILFLRSCHHYDRSGIKPFKTRSSSDVISFPSEFRSNRDSQCWHAGNCSSSPSMTVPCVWIANVWLQCISWSLYPHLPDIHVSGGAAATPPPGWRTELLPFFVSATTQSMAQNQALLRTQEESKLGSTVSMNFWIHCLILCLVLLGFDNLVRLSRTGEDELIVRQIEIEKLPGKDAVSFFLACQCMVGPASAGSKKP